ncbi:hypothetical protein K505DRAFT_158417 [Melanomma pulvis-pyrius CBS 109.77]|uniref:Uncharacterized protein n=1 Tax=Melanomma pulvis-pyrius CBS 109.77 TaxID=1314802 RepID=A0A6A6WPW7_9PLEO|nr:hypothetical protein K505DRAFT_158417 [Melanomma pulvis-pyrius CBS 109.77]
MAMVVVGAAGCGGAARPTSKQLSLPNPPQQPADTRPRKRKSGPRERRSGGGGGMRLSGKGPARRETRLATQQRISPSGIGRSPRLATGQFHGCFLWGEAERGPLAGATPGQSSPRSQIIQHLASARNPPVPPSLRSPIEPLCCPLALLSPQHPSPAYPTYTPQIPRASCPRNRCPTHSNCTVPTVQARKKPIFATAASRHAGREDRRSAPLEALVLPSHTGRS